MDGLWIFSLMKRSVQSDAAGKQFTVSSKCYNHMVYSCQCLVISYLLKHPPGQLVAYKDFFKNQETEMFDQQPRLLWFILDEIRQPLYLFSQSVQNPNFMPHQIKGCKYPQAQTRSTSTALLTL